MTEPLEFLFLTPASEDAGELGSARAAALLNPDETASFLGQVEAANDYRGWSICVSLASGDTQVESRLGPLGHLALEVIHVAGILPAAIVTLNHPDGAACLGVPLWLPRAQEWLRDVAARKRLVVLFQHPAEACDSVAQGTLPIDAAALLAAGEQRVTPSTLTSLAALSELSATVLAAAEHAEPPMAGPGGSSRSLAVTALAGREDAVELLRALLSAVQTRITSPVTH